MNDERFESIDQMEIEPLSDEALETVAGGKDGNVSSDGPICCSCYACSIPCDADALPIEG